MMRNAFYLTLNALFILKIFKFLSWLFGHVEKRLDQKDKINFKICDFKTRLTNNWNTHIDQYIYDIYIMYIYKTIHTHKKNKPYCSSQQIGYIKH